MQIDITLRDILQNLPEKFIKVLTGKQAKNLLDSSLPEVKERRVDLLVELEDGNLFHLELQSKNDNKMGYRMLEYFILLKNKYPEKEIEQMVLYVGDEKLNMKNEIELKNLRFRYMLKDIREINCEELMDSDNIEDKLLSILCEVEDEGRLLVKIIEELNSLGERERKDAVLKLITLSRLRKEINKNLERIIEEGKMPITIDLEKDPYYLKGMEHGIEKGIEKGIERGLLEAIELGFKLKFGKDGDILFNKAKKINKVNRLREVKERLLELNNKEEIEKLIDRLIKD